METKLLLPLHANEVLQGLRYRLNLCLPMHRHLQVSTMNPENMVFNMLADCRGLLSGLVDGN